jgi:hypothetical protein
MCWINRASDPMKYVTGQHESSLSTVLTEIRDTCGGHPEDYTIYLEEDNIAQQVFKPVLLKDLRTVYVWPAMTGVGVINATYEEDGTIYINGEVLPEEYGYGETTPQELTGEVVLGDDEYFVLGDNREISLDSRYAEVGNVPRSIIIGRAWLRLYPFSEFGLLTDK